jgi:hypothetical protein
VASSIATTSFNNILLASNVLANKDNNIHHMRSSKIENTNNKETDDLTKISSSCSIISSSSISTDNQVAASTVLNKPQLQQCLIHLLTSDEKFLNSLHQAYLATTQTIHMVTGQVTN